MKERPRTRRSRDGLTLIELLVALSLASMILVALFGVTAQIAKSTRYLKKERPLELWKDNLVSQFESDFIGCRTILASPSQILMEGYQAPSSFSYGGPCRIRYFIQITEDETYLVRETTDLLQTAKIQQDRQLVCTGVSRFDIKTRLSTDTAPGLFQFGIIFLAQNEAEPQRLDLSLVRHGLIQ
ncbi:MAG: prepilin-type N-terminal cleavage/methylation domain-containing protein [Planctomycetota bacterium]